MADAITFQPITSEGARELGARLSVVDPWAHYHSTPDALEAYFNAQEPDAPRFEIRADGVLAGAISIRKNWLRGPYLQLLAILPPFQKRGIGSAALSWFEAEARESDVRNIWVVASAFNDGALGLYERFGFVRVATFEGLVAEGTDEILLRKRLIIG